MPRTQDGREHMHITGSECDCGRDGETNAESVAVLIKFGIRDSLRFLSHIETLRVFQRACIRAGIEIQYTKGFNPHPKLSLPLPRTVGVESEDDLLYLKVLATIATLCRSGHTGRLATMRPRRSGQTENQSATSTSPLDCDELEKKLSDQLPQGCQLLTVSLAKDKTPLQPTLATYILPVKREHINEKLKAAIVHLLASESLSLQRWKDEKKSWFKTVDVRDFLKSIRLDKGAVIVECRVSSAGSIRVDEILKLLELDAEKLAGPIKRTAVEWQNN
ncbi:MAG: TIGR03936 family radical SAM-associated protein [Sedimentisphaerales bacterium]|nr:TIGR03936 family radical SAM-associated protein [Sedimentisphaerales bacterium]